MFADKRKSDFDSFVRAGLYFAVMHKTVCPKCGKPETVRKILWGMPSEDVNLDEYFIGGCVIDSDPAQYICIACEYEFGARQQSRFIIDSLEGITIICGVCEFEYPATNLDAHICSWCLRDDPELRVTKRFLPWLDTALGAHLLQTA